MRAYASRVIPAPVDTVWETIRRFDRLCDWHAAVVDGSIDDGRPADSVGAVRSFHLADGTLVRERLLALNDSARELIYGFVTPAFPIDNYIARIAVSPVTANGASFIAWWADFDEPAGRDGTHAALIETHIFAAGLSGLEAFLAERTQ